MSSATTAAAQQRSIRRGGFGEDSGGKLDSHLPPRVVIGPDENGVKKLIEYRVDKAGNMVKVVTIITPIPKFEGELKSGDAVKEGAESLLTVPPTKGILLERPIPPGSNIQAPLAGSISAVPMACKICSTKGDHWTSKCPYRKAFADKPTTAGGPSARSGDIKGLCPRPIIREPADRIGDDVRRIMYDDRTVRVTNLSEDTTEPGLVKLFEAFGYVTQAYIPVDEKSGSGRAVGFVKFAQRREAEAAIWMLNGGYTFDNCKIQVGWAAPRVN